MSCFVAGVKPFSASSWLTSEIPFLGLPLGFAVNHFSA